MAPQNSQMKDMLNPRARNYWVKLDGRLCFSYLNPWPDASLALQRFQLRKNHGCKCLLNHYSGQPLANIPFTILPYGVTRLQWNKQQICICERFRIVTIIYNFHYLIHSFLIIRNNLISVLLHEMICNSFYLHLPSVKRMLATGWPE